MRSRKRRRTAATIGAGEVVRGVRERLAISQEALSRLLSATKGAVQHWERGRNKPDFARLVALRRICPPSPERRRLDKLLNHLATLVTPSAPSEKGSLVRLKDESRRVLKESPEQMVHRREHQRLDRQVELVKKRLAEGERRVKALGSLVNQLLRELHSASSARPNVAA